jgi:anti-sigma-K factor RskA
VKENAAAEAFLGALTADERRRLEAQRMVDPDLERAVAAMETMLGPLWMAAPPVEAPVGLWERLDAAIDRTDVALVGMREVAFETGWDDLAPGVGLKRLWENTVLVRCAAGAVLPGHAHASIEHTLVVSGDLELEGARFGAGDYHAMAAGSRHPDLRTRHGCVLLISYAA